MNLSQLIILLLVVLTTSSCSLKTGAVFFNDKGIDSAKSSSPPYEIEFDLLKKGQSLFSFSAIEKKFDIEPDVRLLDLDLTWRYFFSNGEQSRNYLGPYLGGGFGHYKLSSITIERTCPPDPGTFCFSGPGGTITEKRTSQTFSKGYNPHLVIGTRIPLSKELMQLVFEYRYEFEKEESGFNLDSNVVLLGLYFPILNK